MSYLECEECPYAIEDIERRKRILGNDYQPEYVWCEKVGGKHYAFGWCSDCGEIDYTNQLKILRNKSTKRSRKEKYNNKLKRLYDSCRGYPSPVIKYDWINFEDVELPYYKRSYKGNHKGSRYKFYKKHSNKLVRRSNYISNYGGYKKIFDYWWTVD